MIHPQCHGKWCTRSGRRPTGTLTREIIRNVHQVESEQAFRSDAVSTFVIDAMLSQG